MRKLSRTKQIVVGCGLLAMLLAVVLVGLISKYQADWRKASEKSGTRSAFRYLVLLDYTLRGKTEGQLELPVPEDLFSAQSTFSSYLNRQPPGSYLYFVFRQDQSLGYVVVASGATIASYGYLGVDTRRNESFKKDLVRWKSLTKQRDLTLNTRDRIKRK